MTTASNPHLTSCASETRSAPASDAHEPTVAGIAVGALRHAMHSAMRGIAEHCQAHISDLDEPQAATTSITDIDNTQAVF